MATDCITQVTFHGDGFAKPVVARLDQPQASTDGGLVLLKALDIQLGLSKRVAGCLDDAREPGKVRHEAIELLQQRLFGLCAGYADCNDAARLVHDPIHKLVLGRDPLTGLGLASQPPLSRFGCSCGRPSSGRCGGCGSDRRRRPPAPRRPGGRLLVGPGRAYAPFAEATLFP